MNLVQVMDIFNTKDFALVLRCLLDRIPIIIGGNDPDVIDSIILELCSAVSIRKELVFGTDFFEVEEYKTIVNEENLDYDNQRMIFRSPVGSEDIVLAKINDLRGWVVGLVINGNVDAFFEKASRLRKKNGHSLFIKLRDGSNLDFIKFYGDKSIDTSLELRLIKTIFSETENSLARIKRVLDKKIIGNDSIGENIINDLVDLGQEDLIIKENMFQKEIMSFYQASRRGLALLSRLNFFSQFQPVKVGRKAFFEAISYPQVDTGRFLDFIEAEWGEKFEGLVDDSLVSILGDHLDSLWG